MAKNKIKNSESELLSEYPTEKESDSEQVLSTEDSDLNVEGEAQAKTIDVGGQAEVQADATESASEEEVVVLPKKIIPTKNFSFQCHRLNRTITINCKKNEPITDPHLIQLILNSGTDNVEVV